tara:strand:+ start:9545 stop:9721 length:177 start_codon:yes stop_codon:yes gene_type:complete
MKDWIKVIEELSKKQKAVDKLADEQTNPLILEGLAMLSGELSEELFEAMEEANSALPD